MTNEQYQPARMRSDFDAAPEGEDGAATDKQKKRGLGFFGEIVFVVVGALLISALLRQFVFQTFIIPSGSMENTLLVGDRVVAVQMASFHRGDVVVFEDSEGWLNQPKTERTPLGKVGEFLGLLPTTDKNYLVKRVIGMPGDKVTYSADDRKLRVNGAELDESSYLFSEGGVLVNPASQAFEIVVPKDRIFVMGDHRNESGDSRCHLADMAVDGAPRGMTAFVPQSSVVGPAKLIMAPLSRWSTLSVPDTFRSVPDSAEPAPDKPIIKPEDVGC